MPPVERVGGDAVELADDEVDPGRPEQQVREGEDAGEGDDREQYRLDGARIDAVTNDTIRLQDP